MAKKRMTKSEFVGAIAKKSGMEKKQVNATLTALNEVVYKELSKGAGEVVRPGLIKLVTIKKPGLAVHLHGRHTTQLLLSDVPGSDPHVIGSGLLVPHASSDLALRHLLLPEWIREALHKAPALPAPEAFASVTTYLLASNQTARWAAQRESIQRGFPVVLHDYDFQGQAELLGSEFARSMLASPAALHIWGGEATVKLPLHPGLGGRCQHLALCAALQLAGSDGLLLAAGTDGSDGPGEDAGALVDGGTVLRGEQEGFSAPQSVYAASCGLKGLKPSRSAPIQTSPVSPSGKNSRACGIMRFSPGCQDRPMGPGTPSLWKEDFP